MKPKITHFRDYYKLCIYINGILHVQILTENHDGMQSWFEGSKDHRNFFIELYRKEGEPILLGYDEFSNWKKILELLDKNL